MSVVPESCIHKANGIDPVPGCFVCNMRSARATRLDVRHYGRTFIDELDEKHVTDSDPAE
jgi:hypothetical protein